MSKQFTFSVADAILKFIDEKGGKIKKVDIPKSHYTSLEKLAHEKSIEYSNENEIELTEDGRTEIEYLKKFHKRGYEKLGLRSTTKIHYIRKPIAKRPPYSKKHSKTETIERKTAGEIKASILKLLETKGKIQKEEVGNYYLTFESMIESGLAEPVNDGNFYKISERGKGWLKRYKNLHRKADEDIKPYENIKL